MSMRKNQQYFEQKLILMYRRNVLSWIKENLCNDDDEYEDVPDKNKPRMYYQYKSLGEIQERIKKGKVLSGFKTPDSGNIV